MHYLSYNEKRQHGSAQFPVAYYCITDKHPRYNMAFHWHKEWEIIRVLQGTMSISVDGKEYHIKDGDILLLREGILHGGIPQKCIYQCLDFDLHSLFTDVASVKECIRLFSQNVFLPTIYYPDYHPNIYPVIDELFSVFSKETTNDYRELMTLGNLSRLYAIILEKHYYVENTDNTFAKNPKTVQLKPVLEYIESNFASSLTVSELADVISMNPKYFNRFFRSITQQTPMNYVNYYRIEKAANMLCNTNLSVTEVGLDCGFNDISHFVKTFRKFKGTTPKQYQKKNA